VKQDSRISAALEKAWHRQSAEASLTRWYEVCRKEGWGEVPDNLPLLIGIFGASWYFTRYIFYRGRDAALLLDNAVTEDFNTDTMARKFAAVHELEDTEQQLEELRQVKNEVMLQILACHLTGQLDQPDTELALTRLANTTLAAVLDIFDLYSREDSRIAVYGMGRMAGDEMTFGSDLDLIFLFENTADEVVHNLSRKVRMLMRHIAAAGSAGTLYDVDMRLRPHGTSGALLTSASSFIDYHQAECEIWERQMMTRCRAVIDPHGLGQECLDRISPFIFAEYDQEMLRREISTMRKRVEHEKGKLSGKHEVKRGPGGIMDIDFLTHFLQLGYGNICPDLRTSSTRTALQALARNKYIKPAVSNKLLHAYDFLKKLESSIRLFDMKPVSAFSEQSQEHLPVAAAMGYTGDDAGKFIQEYQAITAGVRKQFREIVGDPPEELK